MYSLDISTLEETDSELHQLLVDFCTPVVTIRNSLFVKRNALCPCGSGKKYKKCCLKEEVK